MTITYLTNLLSEKGGPNKFKQLCYEAIELRDTKKLILLLKKSGLTIDQFGSGKCVHKKTIDNIIEHNSLTDNMKSQIKKILSESDIFNLLYSNISSKLIELDSQLPKKTHDISVICTCELLLRNLKIDAIKMLHSGKSVIDTTKKDNQSEKSIDNISTVLSYLKFKGNISVYDTLKVAQ